MNGTQLLQFRVAEELRELERIWGLLDTSASNLARARYTSFNSKYSERKRELNELLKFAADAPPWRKYGNAVKAARHLEREIFCYVAGRLLHEQGLDQGVGMVADLLLEELAERTGIDNHLITTLEFDFGAETMDGGETIDPLIELVRLNFPGAGIWDLPILAHEFGHYAIRELRGVENSDQRPILELVRCLAAENPGQWQRQHVEEVLADAYATYTVGPAYPLSCIVLRVPPADLDRVWERHPSWRHRVTAMIETLRQMTQMSGKRCFRIAADEDVRPLWLALTGGVGPEPDANDLARLQRWTARITAELHRHVSGLMYDDGRPADNLTHLLTVGTSGESPSAGSTVAHVLNAAWRWRLNGGHTTAELDSAAEHCRRYCVQARKRGDDHA
jgi:hypothetical protein